MNSKQPGSGLVRNGFIHAGVIALAGVALVPVVRALWRVVEELLRPDRNDRTETNALRVGWTIVAVGFVVACMVILLRLKVRQEDERVPPLAPALVMVAIGATLVALVSLTH